jgi:hypothetical protein
MHHAPLTGRLRVQARHVGQAGTVEHRPRDVSVEDGAIPDRVARDLTVDLLCARSGRRLCGARALGGDQHLGTVDPAPPCLLDHGIENVEGRTCNQQRMMLCK